MHETAPGFGRPKLQLSSARAALDGGRAGRFAQARDFSIEATRTMAAIDAGKTHVAAAVRPLSINGCAAAKLSRHLARLLSPARALPPRQADRGSDTVAII